jgi:hypothetical protein
MHGPKSGTVELFVKHINKGLLRLVSLAQQLATPDSIDIGTLLYNSRI